jgi:hypothetical protein
MLTREQLDLVATGSSRDGDEVLYQLPPDPFPLSSPGAWVRDTFGECPDEQRERQAWEGAVRRVALYRADYELTDSRDVIGPRPQTGKQCRDWERARSTIERTQRRLGRDVAIEHDSSFEPGR